MLPGEKREVLAHVRNSDLGAAKPVLAVDGFNVAPVQLPGSWRAYKISRSENGSIIKFRCTADGFSAETPLGERFDARFDGKDYPLEDDPSHAMVSAKLLSPSTVEQTNKRAGKIIGVLRLTVAPDGKTIQATYENKEAITTTVSEMRKQP